MLAFNAHVVRSAGEQGDVVLDVDWLAQSVGLYDWHDERDWLMARMPFSQRAVPAYADLVARTVAAMRGKARKCLVLDLDNTVWGGVIGDDGLDGIALNQGDARGEAHRAVQAMALDLRRRGVVLAVCSKNDDATARQPFRSHPGMLLKEDDIAVFVANWEDKATNLERIAQRLDIGLDALGVPGRQPGRAIAGAAGPATGGRARDRRRPQHLRAHAAAGGLLRVGGVHAPKTCNGLSSTKATPAGLNCRRTRATWETSCARWT